MMAIWKEWNKTGEYYNWVNVDKKEYLRPSDFNLGSKSHESLYKENDLLCALRELLFTDWKGCRIVFLGDECSVPVGVADDLFQTILKHTEEIGYPGDLIDTICESYKNVSCLFKASEESVREEISFYIDDYGKHGGNTPYNEYGIDVSSPYKGLFLRVGQSFQYTLNHTKKVGYSLDETRICYLDGTINEYGDPLPILMGYGRVLDPGKWLGDIVGVDDKLPLGYTLLPQIFLDW